ncbi:MAG TPA: DUF5808 domain-containing protein [Myxococcales bacterium]|jgi:uncharacterized membrane protein
MTDIREASLQHDSSGLPGGVLGQSLPFAMLAACGVWLASIWDQLPLRMPVHWDIHGRPDRIVSRTWYEASFPLLFGAFLCAMLLVLSLLIRRQAPRGAAKQPSLRIVRAAGVLIAAVCCAAVVAMASGGKLFVPAMSVMAAMFVVFAAYAVALFARYRGKDPLRNPSRWRAVFYADRDDPALLVQKRIGIGYTINFGHPAALPLMALLALLPIAGIVAAVLLR